MRMTPIESKITAISKPVAKDLGLELICVKILGNEDGQTVQIMAENTTTKSLDVNDCAKLSRAISTVMDVEDPIKGKYKLEISSPGIDRPLVKPSDFESYAGLEAKLETQMPTETGQKRFRGIIKGINKDNNVLLDTDQGEIEIPFAALSKAKLVLTDELIKATANS